MFSRQMLIAQSLEIEHFHKKLLGGPLHLNVPIRLDDQVAIQVAELFIHDALATLAHANAETHDRVPMHAVMRSIERMELPSASIATAMFFFSVGRLFAIRFLG